IALVLQILPVGAAIIADRYTYLPYIGIFFIFSHWINNLLENKSVNLAYLKIPAIAALTLFSIIFCYATVQRCKIWHDSITLWNDAIQKDPGVPKSYNGRGDAYNLTKQYDKAIVDLSKAVQLKPDYAEAYYNRGLAYYFLGKYNEAITDYTSALKYNPQLAVAFYNRSGTYFTLQKFQPALEDALKARLYGYEVDQKFIEALEAGIKSTIK
ncbi:MAG: tetratricopeptide repeat protein, partial [Bacteroidetes bacterium]|nr:tetratricopeptide repeat protein [Bacteroidota bacterium]